MISAWELDWKRRDGSLITVRLSGRMLRDGDGAVEGYEMIVEDVTERRALEEQLRQVQKREAVGLLAGGIAHDFNNFLTTILASVQLLRAERAGDEAVAAELDVVKRASERGAELIRKL